MYFFKIMQVHLVIILNPFDILFQLRLNVNIIVISKHSFNHILIPIWEEILIKLCLI